MSMTRERPDGVLRQHTEGRADRRITARPGRPDRRAIAGGLLVAVAALGLLGLARLDRGPRDTPYLVVSRPVPTGHRIVAADLAIAPMHLHPDTAERALTDADTAIGQVALAPLDRGDLLLDSLVAPADTGAGDAKRRVGLELDVADALNGDLAPGARVDVVATSEDGDASTIATAALVTGVSGAEDASVGAGDRIRVTLEVADAAAAEALVAAAARRDITLVGGADRG